MTLFSLRWLRSSASSLAVARAAALTIAGSVNMICAPIALLTSGATRALRDPSEMRSRST